MTLSFTPSFTILYTFFFFPPPPAADSDTEDTPPIRESHEPDVLPPPELSNLSQIADILSNAKTIQEKDRLASFIVPEVGAPYLYIPYTSS